MTDTKTCAKCKRTLPLDQFVRNAPSSDGRGSYCRPCHNENGRLRDNAAYHRKARYGITQSEYEALVAETGGDCPICLMPTSKWHVDHDHATGLVRGVLCFNCNAGLGKFHDRPEVLERAIQYLTSAINRTLGGKTHG